jgi:hypothetical protein
VYGALCEVSNNLVQNCGFENGFFLPWYLTTSTDIEVTSGEGIPYSGQYAATAYLNGGDKYIFQNLTITSQQNYFVYFVFNTQAIYNLEVTWSSILNNDVLLSIIDVDGSSILGYQVTLIH